MQAGDVKSGERIPPDEERNNMPYTENICATSAGAYRKATVQSSVALIGNIFDVWNVVPFLHPVGSVGQIIHLE